MARLTRRREASLTRVGAYEMREQEQYRLDSYNHAQAERIEDAAFNFQDRGKIRDILAEGYGAALAQYGDEAGETQFAAWRDKVMTRVVYEQMQQDPDAAKKMLGEYGRAMTAKTRQGLHAAVDSAIRTRDLEAGALRREREKKLKQAQDTKAVEYVGLLEDSVASVMETGKALPGTAKMIAEMQAMGGTWKTRGDRYAAQFSQAGAARAFIIENRDRPFEEQRRRAVEELAPQGGAEGYAGARAVRDAVLKHIDTQVRKFDADPAGYAMPRAAEELRMAGIRPDENALIGKSLEIQRRMGVAEPRVLPTDQAHKLRDEYEAADADGKIGIIRKLDQFGGHKMRVLSEIGRGVVPQFAAAIAASDAASTGDARLLIQAADAKDADIPGDATAKNDIKKDVLDVLDGSEAWEALRGVARMQPQNVAQQQMVRQLQDTLVRVGQMAGDANTAGKLLDENFGAFAEDDLAAVFWPRSQAAPDDLEDKLRAARRGVGAFIEYQRGIVGDALFDERVRDLTGRGVWVNAPDGDGFILLAPGGQAVVDAQGEFFRTRLSDLNNTGADADAAEDDGVWF
jgi:hypothetical protein